MGTGTQRRTVLVAAVVALALTGGALRAQAQILIPGLSPQQEPTLPGPTTTAPPTSLPGETTATTAPPDTTPTTSPEITLVPPTTTAPPPEGEPTTTAPPAGESTTTTVAGGEGDGEGGAGVTRAVPPEAQAVISSIARTPPNNSIPLVEGVAMLEAAGVPREDAMRVAYGPFPVLGEARWVDDWYFPRWTGSTFRFHQGLDMMAAFGTPLASPGDGIARITNNALGGLSVKVVEPDGSYWYLAHLSGIAEGLVDGQAVTTGQVVGYVGDSGNARGGAPHLHFGRYQRGVPVPPKPFVDAWVAEGATRVAELLQSLAAAPQPAAVAATDLTRRLTDGTSTGPDVAPTGPPRSELLWASAANPAGGGIRLAEAAAAAVNETVDWDQRAAEQAALDLAWSRSTDEARRYLAPLLNPALRLAVEERRDQGSATVSP